jgi:hypothetical protein
LLNFSRVGKIVKWALDPALDPALGVEFRTQGREENHNILGVLLDYKN